jgi:hypothetical protein
MYGHLVDQVATVDREEASSTRQLHTGRAGVGQDQQHQQDEHVDNSREGRRYQGIAAEASRQPGMGVGGGWPEGRPQARARAAWEGLPASPL